MTLAPLDLAVIAIYLATVVAIGLMLARHARKARERAGADFFAGGRRMPWYLVGTSMVATTLAADTPGGITELVRSQGLAGAWFGWVAALGTVTAAIFFAKLWRRSGVFTDAELVELRYSGKAAAALRGIRAGYLALPINCLILGWNILAISRIVEITTGLPADYVLPGLLAVALGYTAIAGLWGVVAVGAFQFAVAVVGMTVLAFVAVDHAGGIAGMQAAISPQAFSIVPESGSPFMQVFAVYIAMQWWSTRNADGGEYIGLKLFTARSVPDAQLAMLWYVIGEYILKMWPIIVFGLASLALYPAGTTDVFPRLIADHLPAGLRGLLVAAMLAAFLSTVETHLSWGSSYLVNDVYKRFLRPDRSAAHYVSASRWAMLALCVMAAIVSRLLGSVSEAWKLVLALGAGQGLVVMLRWYWWRINAFSEIAAMASSAVATIVLFGLYPGDDHYALRLLLVVGSSTFVWLVVTYLTPPEPTERLALFVSRVQPRGGWWGPVKDQVARVGVGRDLAAWLTGAGFIYSATFAVALLLFGPRAGGAGLAALAVVFGAATLWLLRAGRDE